MLFLIADFEGSGLEMNIADKVCRELELNKEQLNKWQAIVLMDTLLFLKENEVEIDEN